MASDMPTAADYAWDQAQAAKRDNKTLAERVTVLEETVEELSKLVGRLVGDREGYP